MKTNILEKASKIAKKTGFKLKERSPEIFLVAGIVGTVTSAVMACKATTKIEAILEEHNETMDTIHKYSDAEKSGIDIEYTPEDARKDTVIAYVRTGAKFAKLYGPSVVVGVISIAGILYSHGLLKKRYLGVSALLATKTKEFQDYRDRVIEKYGEAIDREFRYNIKAVEIEETKTNKKGETKTVTKTIKVADPNAKSDYIWYFTKYIDGHLNPYWENDDFYVEQFLGAQQQAANDILKIEGSMVLNKVLEMLGFKKTTGGMVVGWIYEPNNKYGDNKINFRATKVKLMNEGGKYEDAWALDFNVDGNIYDRLIEKEKKGEAA